MNPRLQPELGRPKARVAGMGLLLRSPSLMPVPLCLKPLLLRLQSIPIGMELVRNSLKQVTTGLRQVSQSLILLLLRMELRNPRFNKGSDRRKQGS